MSTPGKQQLRIDTVEVPRAHGRLGLCACPGVAALRDPRELDLREEMVRDVATIRDFGAEMVLSLVEAGELAQLGLDGLPDAIRRHGLRWAHLPIADMGVPGAQFESSWEREGRAVHEALAEGRHVVMHCLAGLGRTGTIAARVLVEAGMEPEAAILRVRDARPGSIQNRKQERYVLRLAR